jgi:hypothetical protein
MAFPRSHHWTVSEPAESTERNVIYYLLKLYFSITPASHVLFQVRGQQFIPEVVLQSVPGGKVNILGRHSIGHSKQKECICTCVLFRTVSEIELFHCTVPKLLIRKRYYVMFLIPVFIVQVTKLVQFT